MSRKWIKIVLTVIVGGALSNLVHAQDADDVLRYSLQYPSYDAVSIVMPGVTHPTGFGAWQENPASIALFSRSFLSFGISRRSVSEQSSYLGTQSELEDDESNIGNFGFLYKVPTARGSLVIGGGYSQSSDFNRALSANTRNELSTITDFYNSPTTDDSLFFAAFDAFAIDFASDDSSFNNTESIWRNGNEFRGINQNMELTERGVLGEYAAFIATEFQENLMAGVSIGVINGSYRYERTFLETDDLNDYQTRFDTDGDGQGDTDIDNILSEDIIQADFTAFSARIGLVYRITPYINIGGSYQLRNKLSIDEDFNTVITTTFDDGEAFSDDAPGRFSYKVIRPDRLNLGISLEDINGFTVAVTAEGIRYSSARIEFESIQDSDSEDQINGIVDSNLEDVINLRVGLEYNYNNVFTPRVGYAWFPSPTKGIDADRQFISGGFSAGIFENVTFDLGVQYSFWDDETQLYSFDIGNGPEGEVAGEKVTRWNVMGGVKIGF